MIMRFIALFFGFIILSFIIIFVYAIVNERDSEQRKQNYTRQYKNDTHLNRLLNDIEQEFLKKTKALSQRNDEELYSRLFHTVNGVLSSKPVKLTVGTSDTGVAVAMTSTDDMRYCINIMSITASLQDYNLSFSGDYSERMLKHLGLSSAIMDRIISTCPSTINLRSFSIYKNGESYITNDSSCEKNMIAYNNNIKSDTSYKL